MSNAIKKAIEILGSQKKLAAICGVSQNAISKWLYGQKVSLENALKIEKATNNQVKAEDIDPSYGDLLKR